MTSGSSGLPLPQDVPSPQADFIPGWMPVRRNESTL